MDNPMIIILGLFALFMLVATQFFIFRETWGRYLRAIYELIRTIVKEFLDLDWEALKAEAEEEERNKVKEPLTWDIVKYKYAMPIIFVVLLPIEYIVIRFVFTQAKQDLFLGGIVIIIVMVFLLATLVLDAFGDNEKNKKRKFVLDFVVALSIECGIAFDIYLFTTGYFFESVRGMKTFATSIILIPTYIYYYIRTQRNWHALLDEKNAQESLDTAGIHTDENETNKENTI